MDINNGGVISPGGIGFDINCISGNSKILTDIGEIPISDFEFNTNVITLSNGRFVLKNPLAFMSRPATTAIKAVTECGNSIIATMDHPFLTQSGMVRLGDLEIGDKVATIDNFERNKIRFDEIEKMESIKFNDSVYDFTIPHTHNFIANNFIISNCGMRLVTTNLTFKDVKPKLRELVDLLFKTVPAGVGSKGCVKFTVPEFKKAIEEGAKWCVDHGYGWHEDLERTEEDGTMQGADNTKVSKKAIERGISQVGTLGSGNHYLEIQVVKPENIIDKETAKVFGITQDNQIVVMFHCGSRGFGHQVATDYLNVFLSVMERKYGIRILDRELACAPFNSPEGQDYFAAMKCGLNMSFANRQVILHRIREAFSKVFGQSAEDMGMHCVYDVAHNTAKLEKHKIDGQTKEVLVHRKGATRAFGPGREEVPSIYRNVGQPVIIGGSMETGSYLLVGTEKGMSETFGSTAHGSGRTMSRTRAKNMFRGDKLQKDMERRGIYVRTASFAGLAEEAGAAYKDIDEVIDATEKAGISKKVVKLLPCANVKG